MEKKEMAFEPALERINEIVKLLEKGDAGLEESLALFQEGTELIAACQKLLDQAEQKVAKLRRGEDGSPEEQPFLPEA